MKTLFLTVGLFAALGALASILFCAPCLGWALVDAISVGGMVALSLLVLKLGMSARRR